MILSKDKILDKIMKKIIIHDMGYKTPCFVWTGGTNRGYGAVYDGERNRGVHIVMYEFHVGLVPDGLQLDHLCRIKSCCNPEHLEAVTGSINCKRAKSNFCPYGHEYTPENTYNVPNRNNRICKICSRNRVIIFRSKMQSKT